MRDERGFTIIEVLVAAFVVTVGLLGTVAMIDTAHRETTSSKAREQGIALQRELVEAARSVRYESLLPTSVVGAVQSQVGLADSTPGSGGWTIRRRGVTYSVSLGVCSVDDAKDGTGSHDGGMFCIPPADVDCNQLLGSDGLLSGTVGGAECGIDANLDGQVDGLVKEAATLCSGTTCTDDSPDDYKRVVSLVRWDRGSGTRWALQNALVMNPGNSSGPAVTALTQPGTITGGGSISFTATTSRTPASVEWSVDGNPRGTASGSGTQWSFGWSLDGVLDGNYLVSARALDRYGVAGATRAATVKLNREAPRAPRNFAAGRNGSVVELEWTRNSEGDIEEYRGYRVGATGDVLVCRTAKTSCQDTSPPPDAAIDYYVVAVDRDTTGSQREGAKSAVRTVTTGNNPPNPPTNLVASSSNGNTVLMWSAPSPGDPDTGDRVEFFRIYRDGRTYADRYARTGTGTELTFTDTRTDGERHTYYVTAVDTQLAESGAAGPVTR